MIDPAAPVKEPDDQEPDAQGPDAQEPDGSPDEEPVQIARALDPPARPSILYRPIDGRGMAERAKAGLQDLGTPRMTLALVAFLVLAALGQFALGGFQGGLGEIAGNPINWALGAKTPSLIAHGEYWRLATASFLHGSWVPHLTANLLSLLVLGMLIEHYYGPARMLSIFLFACVTGTLASQFFTSSTSLGASTGVMGLLGALLIHNFRYRAHLPERIRGVYPLLVAMLFVQLTMDVMSSNVDIAGHVGGLAGGGLFAALLRGRLALGGRRELLPVPVTLAVTLGFMAYGAVGLALSWPRASALVRAGRAPTERLELEAMKTVVEQRPHFIEAQLHLLSLQMQVGQFEEAGRRIEALMATDPELRRGRRGRRLRRQLLFYYRMRAGTAYQRGDWKGAVSAYGRLAEMETRPREKAEAHNGYAWTLVDKLGERLDEAEEHALEATRLAPDETAFLDTLAWVYYKQERYAQALEKQQEAVRMLDRSGGGDPSANAEIYYHLGAIQEKLGRKEEAMISYARSLAGLPGYPPAQEALRRLNPASPMLTPTPTPRPAPQAAPQPAPIAPSRPTVDPAVTEGILI